MKQIATLQENVFEGHWIIILLDSLSSLSNLKNNNLRLGDKYDVFSFLTQNWSNKLSHLPQLQLNARQPETLRF